LIDAGADPNCLAAGGVAPLHVAVRTRCAAAVRSLLEHGANPRASNDAGSTPLHLAVQTTGKSGSGTPEAKAQQSAIIRLLIEHGARASDKDGRGKTVAQRARGASLAFIAHIAT
jgi:ankyrin repeat protein